MTYPIECSILSEYTMPQRAVILRAVADGINNNSTLFKALPVSEVDIWCGWVSVTLPDGGITRAIPFDRGRLEALLEALDL